MDVEYFSNLLHQMENITTRDEVEGRQNQSSRKSLKKETAARKRKSIKLNCTFKTTSGLPVFVGKNNKQNDYLTNRKAQNNHLWFHTKDIPITRRYRT